MAPDKSDNTSKTAEILTIIPSPQMGSTMYLIHPPILLRLSG